MSLGPYLDSSYALDLLDPTAARYGAAHHASQWLSDTACSSALTLMECLVRPIANGDQAAEQIVRTFFASLHMLPLTDEVYELAARYRAQAGLKTPDALHLACAQVHDCAEVWTYDARLLAAPVGPTKRAP